MNEEKKQQLLAELGPNSKPTLFARLLSGLVDRSRSECVRSLDKTYKIYKHTPEDRRQLETKLFNNAVDMINEKHPDWGIADYHINA